MRPLSPSKCSSRRAPTILSWIRTGRMLETWLPGWMRHSGKTRRPRFWHCLRKGHNSNNRARREHIMSTMQWPHMHKFFCLLLIWLWSFGAEFFFFLFLFTFSRATLVPSVPLYHLRPARLSRPCPRLYNPPMCQPAFPQHINIPILYSYPSHRDIIYGDDDDVSTLC